MVYQETVGEVGGLEVTLTIEGDDEKLAKLVYADVVGRMDELKQMVDHDIPVGETHPPYTADWEGHLGDAEADD